MACHGKRALATLLAARRSRALWGCNPDLARRLLDPTRFSAGNKGGAGRYQTPPLIRRCYEPPFAVTGCRATALLHPRARRIQALRVFAVLLVVVASASSTALLPCSVQPRAGVVMNADNVAAGVLRSEEHTSELQSRENLVCRLLLEKKKKK